MKNNYNTLKKYILDNSVKEYTKETVNSLFRAVLEPIISNQKIQAYVFLRLNNIEEKASIIKRLEFSGAKLISYNEKLEQFNIKNNCKKNVWENTEFVVIMGQRYSVALLWEFSENGEVAEVCHLHSSSIIGDIAKDIFDNSIDDFKDVLGTYVPDRRQNTTYNRAINNIVNFLDEKNIELIYKEAEGNKLLDENETLKTAEVVADKAKFIAHEIKNNLSIINLYSTITKKRLEKVSITDNETEESINNAMKNIEKASEQISTLINDLRCLSKPYISEFDIKDLILHTKALFEEKLKKEEINLDASKVESNILKADKTKVECALTNIIFNAIDAKCKNIEIKTLNKNDDCFVLISNDGETIKKDNREKIFTPLFTTKEKGNGIGLSYCKKQLQVTNSDINLIQSKKGETTFEIRIGKN